MHFQKNIVFAALASIFFIFSVKTSAQIIVGAQQLDLYLPQIRQKNVALVVNHTSTIGKTHLADSLLNLGIKITKIFAPEHGFRGTASAGEIIQNNIDSKTGIPLISLYGKTKKPSADHLRDIDVVIFDIQDVGVRFYTYPTTMHYVMEACAENNKNLIVLDRPNPMGHMVDGPVLDTKFKSMVGWNPVPVVHGLTVGELAKMINDQKWLKDSVNCNLTVIPVKNYVHSNEYVLPIAPSPNLPNQQSIYLYASLCLFEAMEASVGRGTNMQFQVCGGTSAKFGKFTFTPEDKPGAINPVLEGKLCFGKDLRWVDARHMGFSLKYVREFIKKSKYSASFISSPSHFDRLAGNDTLRKQLLGKTTEKKIRAGWQSDLEAFKKLRVKYLIYPE